MHYKIHEAAKMLGISPQTLRFYEQYGILTSERTGEGGYRQYTDASMDLLMSLRKCRNCGFTVAETAEILKETQGEALGAAMERRAVAMERQAEMDRRIARCMRELGAKISGCPAGLYQYTLQKRPSGCARIIKRTGEKLEKLLMEQVGQFTDWMPLAKWMIRLGEKDDQVEMGFVADGETAAFLGMDTLQGAEHMPACTCAHALVQWDGGAAGALGILNKCAADAEALGYRLSGAPLVTILWNVERAQAPMSYGECWLPVEVDNRK